MRPTTVVPSEFRRAELKSKEHFLVRASTSRVTVSFRLMRLCSRRSSCGGRELRDEG